MARMGKKEGVIDGEEEGIQMEKEKRRSMDEKVNRESRRFMELMEE